MGGLPETLCRHFPETGSGGFCVGGRPLYRPSRSPYRPSRVSGNPAVACRQYHHKAIPFWIPAYAGRTVFICNCLAVDPPLACAAGGL